MLLLLVTGFEFCQVCLPVAEPSLCHGQLCVTVSSRDFRGTQCPVQQQRLRAKHCSPLGVLGWLHLARSVPGQLHTPSAQSWGAWLGRAGHSSPSAGLCQQLISRGCCCQAGPWSILWEQCCDTGREGPAHALLYLLAAHPLSSGYSSYAAVCEKYLKGFSVCIKSKKNTSCL